MGLGKSVRLFLVDGTPGGLVTAEIMNWTGHVTAAPRSDLPALLKRPEVSRTGIYLLLGDDPDSAGGVLAYVGEGDDVSKRLYMHGRGEEQGGKGFWDRAIVLTSKDMNLTKAHARYLEARFITLAGEARRARLLNGTTPPLIPLPEADVSDMEFFVDQAKIVLPVLGVNILRSTKVQKTVPGSESTNPDTSPMFVIVREKYSIDATAQEVDGEFTVRQGSRARAAWNAPGDHNYRKLRQQLEQTGALTASQDGSCAVFTQDQVFSSPSAAAAVVVGRNSNGRMEWKVQGSNMSYGQWQEQLLAGIETGEA